MLDGLSGDAIFQFPFIINTHKRSLHIYKGSKIKLSSCFQLETSIQIKSKEQKSGHLPYLQEKGLRILVIIKNIFHMALLHEHNYNNDGSHAGQNKFRLITIVGVVWHPTYKCFRLIFSPMLAKENGISIESRINIIKVSQVRIFRTNLD